MTIFDCMAKLRSGSAPDRRLDAEVTGCAIGPEGWVIAADEDIDGWAIEAPAADGQTPQLWMYADDVPYATRYLDAAAELIGKARPADAASIMASALRTLDLPTVGASGEAYASAAARTMLAAMLEAIVAGERAGERLAA